MPAQFPAKRSGARWRNDRCRLLYGVVETLSPPILYGSEKDVTPEDVEHIGSYNWIRSQRPTIVVPGSPRIWADKLMPMTVPRDSGRDFIDQNGHRMKQFTLLPIIRAVQDLTDQGVTQKFDWPSVDFVASRGNLRALLAWAVGSSDNWRIDTQLAGSNTVLLSSCAPVTKRTSGKSDCYGFRYEEASTYPILEGETGHFRIVSYNFDGLKLVIRFQVDACLSYDTDSSKRPPDPLVISENVTKKKPSSGSSSNSLDVTVLRAGSSKVLKSELVEIKTHKGTIENGKKTHKINNPRRKETYSQLYLSQTPLVFHAFHESGEFFHVEKSTLGQGDLTETGQKAQEGFKKLRKLLGSIKSLVFKHGEGRVSLVCKGTKLNVYRMPQGGGCLPEDALALFVS